MPDYPYSDQEFLEMAFHAGQRDCKVRQEARPLFFVVYVGANFSRNVSEAFYRQIAEWYQAGYNGFTLVPGQFQQ